MKKILVVSPHPDDETFWMGGTILKLKELKHIVNVLVMSLGEESSHPKYTREALKRVRKAEILKASKHLRIDKLMFANLKDTKIEYNQAYEVIKQIIQQIRPDRIYLPCNPDTHQDHINTSRAGRFAAFHENVKEIFIYDASNLLGEMNFFEDISEFIDKKLDICRIFQSQVIKDHLEIEKIRARALTRGAEIRKKAAEAFKVVRYVS